MSLISPERADAFFINNLNRFLRFASLPEALPVSNNITETRYEFKRYYAFFSPAIAFVMLT